MDIQRPGEDGVDLHWLSPHSPDDVIQCPFHPLRSGDSNEDGFLEAVTAHTLGTPATTTGSQG